MPPVAASLVTVPGGPISAFDRHIGHRQHYDRERIATLLERSGFEVELTLAAGYPFFNLYRLAIVGRGRRLIEDVSGQGEQSRLVALAMRIFGALFRLNVTGTRWGWQTVAVARLR